MHVFPTVLQYHLQCIQLLFISYPISRQSFNFNMQDYEKVAAVGWTPMAPFYIFEIFKSAAVQFLVIKMTFFLYFCAQSSSLDKGFRPLRSP